MQMTELIPFSLPMGLSFIGRVGFWLPFHKKGTSFFDKTPHNLGFLSRGTAKLIEKGHTLLYSWNPPVLPHIFDGLLPKREEDLVLDYGVKMRSKIMEH